MKTFFEMGNLLGFDGFPTKEIISIEDYVKIVCDQLEVLPPDAVMGRVSADAPGEDLAAPVWAARKTEVANEIDKELFARDSWQGKFSGLL